MDKSNSPIVTASFDRRGLFRIGGLTVAGSALVAACSKSQAGELGRVGSGEDTPKLEDGIVDDGVLLRTSASIEHSIVAAYDHILSSGVLAKDSGTFPNLGDQTELVTLLQAHHASAAESFNALAVEVGAEAWECGNPRLDAIFLDTFFTRVEDGAEATDAAKAIEASDDALRDMINLVYTLEALSAASSQALVHQVTLPSTRVAAMGIGVRSARSAALVALAINPGGYLPGMNPEFATVPSDPAASADGPPQTEIPLPVAIASRFGSVAPITIISGRGDENGVRLKLIFETPSLNSLTSSFDSCDA